MSQDTSRWEFGCVRCGAGPGDPCGPIRPTGYATTLQVHSERGAMPDTLRKRGYFWELLRADDGELMYLRRRKGQPVAKLDAYGRRLTVDAEGRR